MVDSSHNVNEPSPILNGIYMVTHGQGQKIAQCAKTKSDSSKSNLPIFEIIK